jgi:hypothetical protein
MFDFRTVVPSAGTAVFFVGALAVRAGQQRKEKKTKNNSKRF